MAARAGRPARAGGRGDGRKDGRTDRPTDRPKERTAGSVEGERLRRVARGRSGAADRGGPRRAAGPGSTDAVRARSWRRCAVRRLLGGIFQSPEATRETEGREGAVSYTHLRAHETF